MTRNIDRPLGLSDAGGKINRRVSRPGKGSVALLIAAVFVGSASAAIALREQPFRTPPVAATSKPEIAVAEAPAAPSPTSRLPPAAPVAGTDRSGPSIIKVNPTLNGEDVSSTGSVIVVRDPSAIGQDLRVAHLPDKALIEISETGPLPIRAEDGRRPMDVYARKWSGARGARIAIVIGGLGLSQTGTQEAVQKLTPEVTLAFAPQGNSIDRWMQAARRDGHEILMQVPLEPFDYPAVSPGRNTLTVDADSAENVANLHWSLSRTTNYTGVMNYMGGRFVTDQAAMGPMMQDLGDRGLLYLDDGSTARSVAAETALAHRVPFAASDMTIDQNRDRAAILGKLDELERTARAKGFAIGAGSAFRETVDAVSSWAREAKKRGIEIVPVSALVSDPERN